MNTFPVPFRIVATVLLTVLMVAVGMFNLRARARWQDPTDGVFWVESSGGLKAQEVYPIGPGEAAGIRPGDILVSMNGRMVADLGQYINVLYDAGIHATVSYELLSGTGERSVTLQLAPRAFFQPRDTLRALLAFFHLGIGLIVILRGAGQPRSFHFYLICLVAFVAYLYSATPRWNTLDQVVYGLSVAAFLLLPPLFVHFCLRFPVDLGRTGSRAPLLYAPTAILGAIQILWMAGRLADVGLPRTGRSIEILDRVHLVYFCLGFLVGGMILLKRKVSVRELTTRQQMKWVSYGTLAGIIPFSLIYGIPWLAGVRPNFLMLSSQLFLGLIPLCFSYAILHYRLLDVESIVRRGAAYFAASSLLLSFYLFFVLVVGRGIEWMAPEADFVVICLAALAIALVFAPLRNAIQRRLDRFFYKDRFDDRASLLDFARTLSTEISLSRLSRSIIERISKTFQLEKVALFLMDPTNPGHYRLTDALGVAAGGDFTLRIREEELGLRALSGNLSAIDETRSLQRAPQLLLREGLGYIQDLKLRGRRIGLIALGHLPSDTHFSTEDLDLLSALAGYASIALENANLYRSIETKALELERLKIYTENIIESINIAVVALDLNGRITSCNRAFEDLYDIRRHQITGRRVEEVFPKDVIESIRKVTGTSGWELKSSSNIFKLYLGNRKGQNLIVNLSIIPLLDTLDLNSGSLIVMDDVTERMRLEDQLMQVEKLSSIGLLAAGIAHEVNTPITGISSYTQMLLKNTPDSDTRKPILEKIEKQTFRAAEIVNGLLNFARVDGSEYKDIDLNRLIRESLALLEHQMKQSNVMVESRLDDSLPMVFGNAGKLQQVFVNLFLNARDAMPSGGNLSIETSKNDTMVVVDIQDSGLGISVENIKKIYDPFFTTKSTGRGVGLGLAITYGIIQEHRGRIFVDSAPEKGTRFKLKLPTRHALHG